VWAELRLKLPLYGFGRHELLPIRKDGPTVALYLSKYLLKHRDAASAFAGQRFRQVSYSKNWSKSTSRFQWIKGSSAAWRVNVEKFCARLNIPELEYLPMFFGPQWAHHLADFIHNVDTLTGTEIVRIWKTYRIAKTPDLRPRTNSYRRACGDANEETQLIMDDTRVVGGKVMDILTGQVFY